MLGKYWRKSGLGEGGEGVLVKVTRPPVFANWHPPKLGSMLPQRHGGRDSIFLGD